MSWTDYKTPVIMIPTGEPNGITRPVRGLGLEDLSLLVVNHLDSMMEITTLYIQSQKDLAAVTNMTDMIVLASKQFPNFVSEVISIVTDTPELRDKKLGVGLQIKILSSALKLTIEDAGGMGNLSAMLQDAVKAALAGRGEVSQRLQAILSQGSTSDVVKTPSS